MAYLEVWLEQGTWAVQKVLHKRPPSAADEEDREAAPASIWRVILVQDDVQVIHGGPDEDELGTAKWSSRTHALLERNAVDEEILTRDKWQHVQDALRAVMPKEPATPAKPGHQEQTGASAKQEQPQRAKHAAKQVARQSVGKPADLGPPLPKRSGWSVLVAALVPIGGAILAWRAADTDTLMYTAIALSVVALGVTSYAIYGAASRCPSCKSWYRRALSSTDLMGTSSENREESVAVYDSGGKQSGTTSRSVTYETRRYNYHYQCRHCASRWTRQGTSTRRLM